MASAGLQEVYDLRNAPVLAPRLGFVMRMLGLGAFALIEGLVAYFGSMNALAGTPATPGDIGFTAGVAAVGCLFLLPYFGLAPGAATVVLNPTGLTLQYRNGKQRRIDWADSKLRLELSEIRDKGRVEYDLTTRMPWHNDLTQEAFEAILSHARSRGLSVGSSVVVTGDTSIRTHRIQRAPIQGGGQLAVS